MHKPQKAYKNLDFLNSPEAREIRILAEYLEPKKRFKEFKIENTIVFFGSSRLISEEKAKENLQKYTRLHQSELNPDQDPLYKKLLIQKEMSRYYEDARQLAYRLTKWSNSLHEGMRFTICSGGGPGIMEAANKGASEAGGESIGLGISLPNVREEPNAFISPHLSFEFHYFFMRKFWFIYLAKALIVFPGGFGTLDELFEVLTLLQTQKVNKKITVVIYGKSFWEKLINFDMLKERYLINENDEELYFLADSVEEAFQYITQQLTSQYVNDQ